MCPEILVSDKGRRPLSRVIAEIIINYIAWLKRNRRVTLKANCIKVNIGCGLAVVKDWVNVDGGLNIFISKWPHLFHKYIYRCTNSQQWYSLKDYCDILENNTFIHHNLEYGLPFHDGTVDYIYSSHLLEHLFRTEASNLLKDAYRALKSGGMIRICVPDLEKAVGLYISGDKEKFLEYFYATSRSKYFGHLYMYDYDLLKKLLEEAGYVQIEKKLYRRGEFPNVKGLDIRPDDSSLYVEAIKQ